MDAFEAIVADVKLGQGGPGIEVKCPPCPYCLESAVVLIDEDEYGWLAEGRSASDALSARPPAFRELFISGIHEHCWAEIFGDEDE